MELASFHCVPEDFLTIPLPITKVIRGIYFKEDCGDLLISKGQSRMLYLFKNKMLREAPFHFDV